jgi:hypothetical protein
VSVVRFVGRFVPGDCFADEHGVESGHGGGGPSMGSAK